MQTDRLIEVTPWVGGILVNLCLHVSNYMPFLSFFPPDFFFKGTRSDCSLFGNSPLLIRLRLQERSTLNFLQISPEDLTSLTEAALRCTVHTHGDLSHHHKTTSHRRGTGQLLTASTKRKQTSTTKETNRAQSSTSIPTPALCRSCLPANKQGINNGRAQNK